MRENLWFTDDEVTVMREHAPAMEQLRQADALHISTHHKVTKYEMTLEEELRQEIIEILVERFPRIYSNMRDPKTRFRLTTLDSVRRSVFQADRIANTIRPSA